MSTSKNAILRKFCQTYPLMIIYLLLNKMLHHAFEVCNFLIMKMTHFRCQNRIVIRKIANKTQAEKNLHYTVTEKKTYRWTQIRTYDGFFLVSSFQSNPLCAIPLAIYPLFPKKNKSSLCPLRVSSPSGGGGGRGEKKINLCMGSGYSTTHQMFLEFAFLLLQWNLDITNLYITKSSVQSV